MKILVIILFFLSFHSYAEIGTVVKVTGNQDGYLLRQGSKVTLGPELVLDEGDELFSENNVLIIYLEPSTQMSLGKNTQIRLSKSFIEEHQMETRSESVIDFIRGYLRVQVSKDQNETVDQKIKAQDVVFGVRGTEFEISDAEDGVDLEVVEGEVEVESSLVATKERYRANEGMNFSRKQKRFMRRKMALKFPEHPGFIGREDLRQKRKKAKERRRKNMVERKFDRNQERRDHRRSKKR